MQRRGGSSRRRGGPVRLLRSSPFPPPVACRSSGWQWGSRLSCLLPRRAARPTDLRRSSYLLCDEPRGPAVVDPLTEQARAGAAHPIRAVPASFLSLSLRSSHGGGGGGGGPSSGASPASFVSYSPSAPPHFPSTPLSSCTKKAAKGNKPDKGGNRFWKSIGLGFETPIEAIEDLYSCLVLGVHEATFLLVAVREASHSPAGET